MAAKYRTIAGEVYKLVGIESNYNKAHIWADNMRRHGERIRVVSVKEGYALYRKE